MSTTTTTTHHPSLTRPSITLAQTVSHHCTSSSPLTPTSVSSLFASVADAADSTVDAFRASLSEERRVREEEEERVRRRNDVEWGRVCMEEVTRGFGRELDGLRRGGRMVRGAATRTKKKEEEGKEDSILDQDNILLPQDEVDDEDDKDGEAVSIDVDVLIRMLRSGMDVWTEEEKRLVIDEQQSGTSGEDVLMEEEDGSILTPHERRRRLLFGNVPLPRE